MFRRRPRRPSSRPARRPPERGARRAARDPGIVWQPVGPPRAGGEDELDLEECPRCAGYGSVACAYCNETGDRDRDNEVDRDCGVCQGWGAVACTACGGRGAR